MAKSKQYKPKSNRTLIRMMIDIRNHCEHVSKSQFFGCHTCPYHIWDKNNIILCWFVHSGGKKPSEWELNEMGTCVN